MFGLKRRPAAKYGQAQKKGTTRVNTETRKHILENTFTDNGNRGPQRSISGCSNLPPQVSGRNMVLPNVQLL